jgi:Zn-dependent protease
VCQTSAAVDKGTLSKLVFYLVPMILSLTVHEFAHAFVATKLGDDTPEREERLTLSPLAHIDPVGTLLFPIMMIIFAGGALFGWAKPVNVSPSRFRRGIDMHRGMALTAVAGPLSNLLLAVLSIAALTLSSKMGWLRGGGAQDGVRLLLVAMFQINVGLCVFNLLPIPPFDGSRLLPRSMASFVEQMQRYSTMLLIVVLMVTPIRRLVIDLPISVLTSALTRLFGSLLPQGTSCLPPSPPAGRPPARPASPKSLARPSGRRSTRSRTTSRCRRSSSRGRSICCCTSSSRTS